MTTNIHSKKQLDLSSLPDDLAFIITESALSALVEETDTVVEVPMLIAADMPQAQAGDATRIRDCLTAMDYDTYPELPYQQFIEKLGQAYGFTPRFNFGSYAYGGIYRDVMSKVVQATLDFPYLLAQLPKPLEFVQALEDNANGVPPSVSNYGPVWDEFHRYLQLSFRGKSSTNPVELREIAIKLPEDYFYQQLKASKVNTSITL